MCLQVTRYAALHGIKYVVLSNYEGTIFGMFCAPNELLLSNLIRFDDRSPSVLEVNACCGGVPNKQPHQAGHICVMVYLSQWNVDMQCIYAITMWASSESLHQPWNPCHEHAPSLKAAGDAANSRPHVPGDAGDDSDHGASHTEQEGDAVDNKQGIKRQRDTAAESSSTGRTSPHGKKASLSFSSVFRISAIVPLLQQQWQEQRDGQHMPPDLGACAAAFSFADICGVVGKGASGRVFAARCAYSDGARSGQSCLSMYSTAWVSCLLHQQLSLVVWCHLQQACQLVV